MFLLGLTYAIVVLLPLLRHQSALLSAPTSSLMSTHAMILEGWSQNLFNATMAADGPCESPGNSKSSSAPIRLEQKNRSIALVHIGKAGGVSLRRMTMVFCKLFFRKKEPAVKVQRTRSCVQKFFPDPGVALAHQVNHYFHIEEYNETEMQESTSFLLTLRNPVDRIISTYRFSHPGNCNEENRYEVWRPRGCEAEKHKNETGLIQNKIFYSCFPSPKMEEFAQAIMRPWKRGETWGPLSKEERRECRYLAREMVQGYGTYGSGPHMLYNFNYYAQRSVWMFPDKEVFGIRTEHEMEDIHALEKLLGGNGNLRENTEVSHGSESFVPSPLSTEAYQKLCCLLELEIEIYEDLLMRVINLDDNAKKEAMDNIREKCGVTTTWIQWRNKCRRELKKDLRLLKPSLIVNETKVPRKGNKLMNGGN